MRQEHGERSGSCHVERTWTSRTARLGRRSTSPKKSRRRVLATPMTSPLVRASLLGSNPLIFLESASRFILGFAPNQWTFSRSMGGPTSYPDGTVSRSSAPWFYGPWRLRSTHEPQSRSTDEVRKTDAWIAFSRAVPPIERERQPERHQASPPCPVTRVIGHAKPPTPPAVFMVNKPLKRRHGDAGAAGFDASSRVSAVPANGGSRP